MKKLKIFFKYSKQNIYSYSALAPLFPTFEFTKEPQQGIMIYSFFTNQKENIYREVEKYKKKFSYSNQKTYFIAGGPHATEKIEEVLKYFDFVIVGEGEITLPELVKYIQKNDIINEIELENISGIAFKNKDNKIIKTKFRNYIDINNFPCFSKYGPYRPIEITRGCLYNCKYCQTPILFGHKLRHRNINEIIKYSKYYNDLRFITPNSFSYGSNGKY